MPASRPDRPHAVYRHFDKRDVLLYVGCTYAPERRWKSHYGRWKTYVVRTAVEWFGDRRTALAVESAAIREEHPLFNLDHNMASPSPVQRDYEDLVAGRLDPGVFSERWVHPHDFGRFTAVARAFGLDEKTVAHRTTPRPAVRWRG